MKEGLLVGSTEGKDVGYEEPKNDGELVPKVGQRVGDFEGLAEGIIDVGNNDGEEEGEHVGFEEGVIEGLTLIRLLGTRDGTTDG